MIFSRNAVIAGRRFFFDLWQFFGSFEGHLPIEERKYVAKFWVWGVEVRAYRGASDYSTLLGIAW